MEQKQASPLVVIAALVALAGGIGYFGWRAAQPTTNTGSYTPGVPPWLDKNSPQYGKSPYAAVPAKVQ